AVCADVSTARDQLLPGIRHLANHHLVVSEEPLGELSRFGMLATIREYALERLEQSGELSEVRRRHASYYLRLVRSAELAYHSRDRGAWLDELERDYDNLRAVLDFCAAEPDRELNELGLELAAGLWFFWTVRGHIREGRDRLDVLLGRSRSE